MINKTILILLSTSSITLGWWGNADPEPSPQPEKEAIQLEKVVHLESQLNQQVIGQEEAVRVTSEAIIRYAAGIQDEDKPIGAFLYVGPTGVGKTELAKQLATRLFGNQSHFFRLNMAEFAQEWTVSRLIGSAPGYVDSDRGGQLTNAIYREPCSVILLDEVEKAHPKVMKVFLQAFDEGYITTAFGTVVDCRNCIFILTSNIGSHEILNYSRMGLQRDELLGALEPLLVSSLSPELYNRLEPVVFTALSKEVISHITMKLLGELQERVWDKKRIALNYDPSIFPYLEKEGYRPEFGVRPLKRVIEGEITTMLARAIVKKEIVSGDTITISYDGTFYWQKQQ